MANSISPAGLITGAATGIIDGIFGSIRQGQQFRQQKKLMNKQQEHALEQMQKSQDYNLENMAIQNQYQIDAENRAREWNDISAQIDRGRAAGVSPLAALGISGNTMSQSNAPSASTPSPAGASGGSAPSFGHSSIASSIMAGLETDEMRAQRQAQADYYRQLEREKQISNYVADATKDIEINIRKVFSDKQEAETKIAQFDASVQSVRHAADMAARNVAIDKATAEMLSIYRSMDRDDKLANATLKEMSAKICLLNAQTITESVRPQQILSEVALNGARQLCAMSQADLNSVLTAKGFKENEILEIEKDLRKFRTEFEKSHKEREWKQGMRNQKWQNATKFVGMLTDLTQAACQVYSTAVTGGLGGTAYVQDKYKSGGYPSEPEPDTMHGFYSATPY